MDEPLNTNKAAGGLSDSNAGLRFAIGALKRIAACEDALVMYLILEMKNVNE